MTSFFNFYTKLAKSSFLCCFRVESVNVFVLPRFNLNMCSSSPSNLTNLHMCKHFPEWVHCQVIWILRGSTLKFFWTQENQTATYFLRSRLFTYDYEKFQLQLVFIYIKHRILATFNKKIKKNNSDSL